MRIPSYLVCNKYGQYHFRICFLPKIPLSSERLVFKKTLKTKDKEFAVSLARAIKVKIDNRNLFSSLTEMNWTETKAVLNNIVEDTIEEYRATILDKGTYGDHIASYPEVNLERQAEEFIQKKSQNLPVKIQDYPLLNDYANQVMTQYALDADPEKYDRNVIQIAEMLFKIRTRRFQMVGSFYRSIPELYKKVRQQFEPVCEGNDLLKYVNGESNTDNEKQSIHDSGDLFSCFENENVISDSTPIGKDKKELTRKKGHLLKELIIEFVEYKIQKQMWKSPETIRLNKMKLGFIHNVLEYIKKTPEIFIDEFEKEDAINFEKIFQRLPANFTKLSGGKSFQVTISKVLSGDTPFGSTMSSVTYNSYCDLLVGMFNWSTLPKQGYLQSHPFIDLKIKNVRSRKREGFSDDDIQRFFNTDLFVKKDVEYKFAWRFFVPVIMAYSGMRLEECCQLLIKNIVKIDGVDCFDLKEEVDHKTNQFITKLKNTDSSKRIVPTHQVLKKIGFLRYLKYLKEKGEEKVFPDLANITKSGDYIKSGAKVSKYFNEDDNKNHKQSYLSKCGINAAGKDRKVLYVFRHTVETLLINHSKDVEHDKIDILLGHQVSSIGRSNYGKYNAVTLSKIVNLIDYPKSNLPWDSNPEYSKIKFIWEK